MKKSIFILVVAAFILQSCAKIFYTPDARPLALESKNYRYCSTKSFNSTQKEC